MSSTTTTRSDVLADFKRRLGDEEGAATAEYAITIMATNALLRQD